MTIVEERTLIEDWRLRRERLRQSPGPLGREYDDAVARVLDFLIQRYSEHPDGKQRALYPLTSEVFIDRRAIVVHRYLGEGQVAGIKSEGEAASRAERLTRRISQMDLQQAVTESREKPLFSGAIQDSQKRSLVKIAAVIFATLLTSYLLVRAYGDEGGRAIASGAVVYASYTCDIRPHRPVTYSTLRTLELTRANLASADVHVRMAAVQTMAVKVTLQDVGLITDLLQLPPSPDELPTERKLLAETLDALVKRTAGAGI